MGIYNTTTIFGGVVMPIDPVCGMVVADNSDTPCSDYEGSHYCFCSEECKEEFDMFADMYVSDFDEELSERPSF